MSKSKGNVINPLEILDEYGAEPLRYYATTCALGKDNAFRQQDIVRGQHISNKLYNIGQLISVALAKGREKNIEASRITLDEIRSELHPVDRWLLSYYSKLVQKCTEDMDNFRFDRSVRDTIYFLWHRLADNYLEMVKNRIYTGTDRVLLYTLYNVGHGVLKLLAPFLCHITEELYQDLYRENEGAKSIHISSWPKPIITDEEGERKGDIIMDITSAVRSYKSEAKLPLNTPLGEVIVATADPELISDSVGDLIAPMAATGIKFVKGDDLEEVIIGIKSDFAKIGPVFKGDARYIFQAVKECASMEEWKRAYDEGFRVEIPGKGEVVVKKEFLIFERGMCLSGKAVETINIPERDITVFIEKK